MRMLLITYDLKAKNKSYEPLFSAIKATGEWWHYLRSTWLVYTEQTVQQVADSLNQHLSQESSDYLLVVEVKKSHQGWLPKDAWAWMNSKLYF